MERLKDPAFFVPMIENQVNINSVLVSLFSGFSFRSKVENVDNGDLYVIQMKDLASDYSEIGPNLTKIKSSGANPKNFLKKHDVLFLSKGANNYAIEYQLDLPMAIAASAFFILRPDPTKIFPSYLAWYINQLPVQQYLREKNAGTYIPNVNKDTLEGINLILPSFDIQKKIVLVDNLRRREHQLMDDISTKRKSLVSAALLRTIEN